MNRWKLAVPVVACLALFAAGCASQERIVVREQGGEAPPQEVYATAAPPAEQIEVIPQASGTDVVWIKGHWHWNGAQWTWRPGRYETRRVGYRWIPAHYETRGNRFVYISGYWGR